MRSAAFCIGGYLLFFGLSFLGGGYLARNALALSALAITKGDSLTARITSGSSIFVTGYADL